VVTGATIYSAYQAISDGMPSGVVLPMLAGMIASAASGYLAIAWLLRLLRTSSYRPFVIYRLVAGTAVLLIIATGLRAATI
jgi:undecaprenyl-diphosphatase